MNCQNCIIKDSNHLYFPVTVGKKNKRDLYNLAYRVSDQPKKTMYQVYP